MAPGIKPPPFAGLPVGSVVEQRQGGRTFLVVQETEGRRSTIESWEDGLEVTNRLLKRARKGLKEINADVSALNKRLTEGARKIDAKIKSNQRLLDKLVKGRTRATPSPRRRVPQMSFPCYAASERR